LPRRKIWKFVGSIRAYFYDVAINLEESMNIRRLQGLALLLSAILSIVGLLGSDTPLFDAIAVISIVLFIIGIPAVYSAQPIGTPGLVGIILLIVAAVIALGFRLLDLPLSPTVVSILIWTSVISGAVGRLIVGWLTTRHRVFPAWAGWAFIVEGLLIAFGGVLNVESFAGPFNIIYTAVLAVALLGYGYYLLRPRMTPALA
jgi:hypothetical protein